LDLPEFSLVRIEPEHGLSSFDCGDEDLNEFLRDDALNYQQAYLASTSLLLLGDRVICYFSLAADAIALTDDEMLECNHETPFKSFPALKICRLATDVEFKGQGWGTTVIEFCIGLARHLNDAHTHDGIGCRYVTVDAYPGSADWYIRRGFVKNESKLSRRQTISLRIDAMPVEDIPDDGEDLAAE